MLKASLKESIKPYIQDSKSIIASLAQRRLRRETEKFRSAWATW